MDWVFDHLRLLIGAAGVVAWWLNQRRLAKANPPEPHKSATFNDPELAERTRRIREDIQRKIEERARAYTRTETPAARTETIAPPPIIREVAGRRSDPAASARASRAEAVRTAEILEQQAALADRLREAKQMKEAAAQRIQFENQLTSAGPSTSIAAMEYAEDLRDPKSLRRAFLLREIIGPPVALR
jgi:hypothetical protein